MASRSPLIAGARSCARSTAAPIVGWPANDSSRAGVKMRILAECAGFSGLRHEHRFGGLNSRDGLHRLAREPVGVVHHGQRVAPEAAIGEHVERMEEVHRTARGR